MKNSILKSALLVFISIVYTSCSNSDDNGNNPTPTTENTWSLNSYKFSRRVSTQELATTIGGKNYTIIIVDSNIATNNNNFSVCQAVFYFNSHLPGVYTIKSNNTWLSSDLNYMNIKCTAFDPQTNKSATYESSDSNVTTTVTSIDNKLVVTAPNQIVLTKTSDDGLVDAPATIIFKCDRVQ
jgi:hypothetical protein